MPKFMHSFPPEAQSQVTLANWRMAPFNKWGFHHVREIVPSADIPPAPDHTAELQSELIDLNSIKIDDSAGSSLPFNAFLPHSHTDGLVILHRGNIVFEHYTNGMTAHTPHILMSVSKSMLGLLAGALVGRGELDPERLVTDIIPEVAGTAYDGATIQHLLDMRVGIDFDEDYLATSGPIIAYRKSTNWNPLEPGEVPSDLRSFFGQLTQKSGPHGGPINYVSPNCDLLGWIMERASGRRYCDLMSELLWQPLGAAHSAYITVDRLGAPRCAGGMCTTTRDLARVGQMIVRGGDGIIPENWLNDLAQNGDPDAWKNGNMAQDFPELDVRYRNQWYAQQEASPLLFGFGIHGQYLIVDRRNEIVIAKFSSQPIPIDVYQIMLTMRAVAQVVSYLTDR
jgi:CubicO group peptidase (beta-lactamase class C family)